MPKTESFPRCSKCCNNHKAKKAAGMQTQNVVRKKLADISNQPQNRRLIIQDKSQSIEKTTEEYINQLQKENMALVKMLAQRNKIIEGNRIEIDRVRVNVLKIQEQNQQLAVSNDQMLAELNSGNDRLIMYQHELECKTGLIKASKLNVEGRTPPPPPPLGDADAELSKSQEEIESSKENIVDEKPRETMMNPQPNDACPSEQVEYKDTSEKERCFLRRQSARFQAAEVEPAEYLFEANKTTVSATQLLEDSASEALVRTEGSVNGSQQFKRSSLSRPSRAAAKKIQSYKEVPVNVKLRRP